MRTSYPVRDLVKYEYLGTYTITDIRNNCVILDKPFDGRPGDFLAGDGEFKIGAVVTGYRDIFHASV